MGTGRRRRAPVRPIIGVVGGSTCSPEETAWAEAVGRGLAEQGAVLVCGGLGGVMEAASRGAKAVQGSLTIGILPGSDRTQANPWIDLPFATGMGEMRNALVVRVCTALIAIGGGWGTLSEIALARRIGTPVVGLHDAFSSILDIPRAQTAGQAVRWALEQNQGTAV